MTKLKKLRDKMAEIGVDSVIVLNELNQRYLSDFSFSDGYLFITQSSAYLVTDFRYYEMALKIVSSDFEVTMTKDRREFLLNAIAKDSVKTIGFEGGSVSYSTYILYNLSCQMLPRNPANIPIPYHKELLPSVFYSPVQFLK